MSELRLVLELLGDDAHQAELPDTGTLVVGSSHERASFVVEGQGVDDAHCAIGRTREGDWAVKDLGSRTGTLLNGQRVSSARLKPGDQLVLGSRRLEVRPVPAPAPRAAEAEAARPGDLPQRIGGYRIERLIGKGGMGSVYLAVQESLRRPVALKVLAPRLAADRDFVHRFQAEARAAAALSHPNVVVVYDVGEEGGSHYLSMEFMAGGSLEQKLAASGPLPWRMALGVLGDAAAGLAYAESRGIVHRDIKPANLMYSGTGAVKIADLGLATTLEQEASEAGDGRKVYGTPHFISPEQARGEAVDHRSDLYSLGATLYRLLSGRTPFERPTTREILRALQTEEPRSLRSFVPYLPAELEALVERLMAKDPNERFATAESLRRECERLRLMAEHGPALEQRSSRAGLWIGILLLLGAAGAGAWFTLRPKPAPVTPDPGLAVTEPDEGAPSSDDPSFFGNQKDAAKPAPDEEVLVREREREASAELGALTPLLSRNERRAALQRITERYSGTEAARAAQGELSALDQPPEADSAEAAAASLEEVRSELRQRLLTPAPGEPVLSLAERLRALDDYRPEASIAAEFEALRAELGTALVGAERDALAVELTGANQLAQRGQFAELRKLLADLAPRFAGLEALGGDPARLAPVLALRGEIETRIGGVDAEERSHHSQVERANRLAVGAALGPGSAFLTELANLDFDALDRRLAELPRPQRERPLCQALIQDLILARGAFDSLRREFAAGTPAAAGKGWRRKFVLDPRSKKVREVRDLRPDALVFDKDGALENVPWRETRFDTDWWSQLFQLRLTRDWTSDEVRGILALLRLMGAARGAELARGILVPSGILAAPGGPAADLQALVACFDATAPWLEDAGRDASAVREALALERAAAAELATALELSGQRSWADCAAALEHLLAERSDSFLVGLLSNGSEWRVEQKPPAAPKPEAGATPTTSDAPKDGK